MSHENSQFEISGIQLRESRTQPRVSLSREIGEAQITHNIFGKAKVRIIRKGDHARRAMILAAVAATALAAAVWLGWFTPQQTELVPNAALSPEASAVAQSSLPAESAVAAVPPVEQPAALQTGEIPPPQVNQKPVPQQAFPLKDVGQKAEVPAKVRAKPETQRPKADSAEALMPPQAGAAANRNVLKNQLETEPVRPLPAKRHVTPPAALPVVQPAASSPAVAVPPKDDMTIQPPIGDKPMSDPINVPGK